MKETGKKSQFIIEAANEALGKPHLISHEGHIIRREQYRRIIRMKDKPSASHMTREFASNIPFKFSV